PACDLLSRPQAEPADLAGCDVRVVRSSIQVSPQTEKPVATLLNLQHTGLQLAGGAIRGDLGRRFGGTRRTRTRRSGRPRITGAGRSRMRPRAVGSGRLGRGGWVR